MAQSVLMVDPVTGAPLEAQATLSGCFVILAAQVFTYNIPRTGPQHTHFLRDPMVLDCQSTAIGISLLTAAVQGQVHRIDVLGNVHGGKSSKIT